MKFYSVVDHDGFTISGFWCLNFECCGMGGGGAHDDAWVGVQWMITCLSWDTDGVVYMDDICWYGNQLARFSISEDFQTSPKLWKWQICLFIGTLYL
jgi:hypothetical protein